MTNAKEMKYTNLLGKSTKMYSSVLGVEKYMIFYNSSGFFNKLEWYLLESLFFLNQWAPWKISYLLNDHLPRNPNHYLLAAVPVDTQTKSVRTKDVHKRTFIFGSNWKHGKTSQSERLMNVPIRYVLKTSFSRPSFFFSLTHLEQKLQR